jgi:hypothetical protein
VKESEVAKPQVPEFSKEAIVTSVGVTVVQALDFLAKELSLSDEETQQLWSPFLAATARLIKPADDMAAVFQNKGFCYYPFVMRIKGSAAKAFLIALAVVLIPVTAVSAQKITPGTACKVLNQKVT